jgi:hypothetical protein
MPPPHPPPELVEDAVSEILLRLPPDEPACLVRASLVCKRWRRVVSDPASWMYSSVDDSWSEPASVQVGNDSYVQMTRGLLVGDEIYFEFALGAKILKYDLGKNCLALMDSPHMCCPAVLMLTSDNLLGLIGIEGLTIHLWSRKVNPNGVAVWAQSRLIELENLIPSDNLFSRAYVIGFV